MDGGGRLAGTLKQRRPQTESRNRPRSPAAAGAPARVTMRGQPVRARRHEVELPPPGILRQIAHYQAKLPRYSGLAATGLILLASLGLGIVKGDHLETIVEAARDVRDAAANSVGFRIADVSLNGRRQLTQDEILATGGVTGKRSLLFLDAVRVREKLLANPWIAEATVLKLYPDRLAITIKEREAFALWQKDGRIAVIAQDGAVLEPYVTQRFTKLPLVVGSGAQNGARNMIALISRYPELRDQVHALVMVGERRWNLHMKNGIDVRLPEEGVEQALKTLVQLDRDKKILTRDIAAIDMRLPDRVSVRLSEEAFKAREALVKDKKNKRKAGDA